MPYFRIYAGVRLPHTPYRDYYQITGKYVNKDEALTEAYFQALDIYEEFAGNATIPNHEDLWKECSKIEDIAEAIATYEVRVEEYLFYDAREWNSSPEDFWDTDEYEEPEPADCFSD